jgi:cytochrome c-type biogenesis protein CcmH
MARLLQSQARRAMANVLALLRAPLRALLRAPLLAIAVACAFAGPTAIPLTAHAREALPAADDPALEARMLQIASELRCLVCQNQTLADSHAGLAEDLREEVRAQLRQGKSDDEIRRYMTDRYGDFVLYRPPVKSTTLLLWFGPAVLLVGGIAALLVVLRGRSRLGDDRFEPDDEFEGADALETADPRAAR